jgi:hypothetical protein
LEGKLLEDELFGTRLKRIDLDMQVHSIAIDEIKEKINLLSKNGQRNGTQTLDV